MKVKIELQSGKSFTADLDTRLALTEHFTLGELANNLGDKSMPQYILNTRVDLFLAMIEEFRVWFARPISPSCSYRQPKYNQKVGGIATSLHVKGLAIDIPFSAMTDAQWKNICTKWAQICKSHGTIGEMLRYKWGFHLGIDVTYQKTHYIADKR